MNDFICLSDNNVETIWNKRSHYQDSGRSYSGWNITKLQNDKEIKPFSALDSDVICPDQKEQNGLDRTSQEALYQG